MIETAVCNSAKLEFLQGLHSTSDRYAIALYVETANLGPETTNYKIEEGEVYGQGYQAGGKRFSTATFWIENGEARIIFSPTPITWENASILARGAMIYNASKGNAALATFNFGDDIISSNGPFSVKIPANGAIILS